MKNLEERLKRREEREKNKGIENKKRKREIVCLREKDKDREGERSSVTIENMKRSAGKRASWRSSEKSKLNG